MYRPLRLSGQLAMVSMTVCALLAGCGARVDRAWDDLPEVSESQSDPVIARLQKQAEVNPNSGEVYAKLAEAYLRRGQAAKGTEAALRVLELEPENDEIMRLLLNLSLSARELGPRIAQFCSNLANDKPGQSRALNIIGVLLLRSRRVDRAIRFFERATEADPNLSSAAANLAVCHALKGDDAEANEWRTRAARLAPSDPALSLALAGVYTNKGQVEKALPAYERALSLAPNSPHIYVEIGRTHAIAGSFDKAEDAFRHALTIQSGFVPAHISLGKLLASRMQYKQALEQFNTAASLAPNTLDAHLGAGLLSYLLGDLTEAEKELRTALQINPSCAEAANALADLYANRNDNLDTALQLAERATALEPSDPSIGDTHGWVLVKLGKTQEAIEKLSWAARKAPDHPTITYHLGVAYYQAGDRPRAVEWLRRALASEGRFASPSDGEEARKLLAKLSHEQSGIGR